MTTPDSKCLPNRRPSETRTLTVGNHAFSATVGFDPADGRPCEVFLDGAKHGSELAFVLNDAAVTLSIALQSGIPASALAKSVARVPSAPLTPADLAKTASPRQTAPASVIGAVLDLVAQFERGPPRTPDNVSSRATENAPERP